MLRFFTVYGPRQRPDLAIHKFGTLIRDDKPIPVFGDGTTGRDYTFSDDTWKVVTPRFKTQSDYQIFNLGESETVELSNLIELLEKKSRQKSGHRTPPMEPGDVPITFADISKSRELLGYNPQTKIEDGIPKFVEWFLDSLPSNKPRLKFYSSERPCR